MIATGLVFVLGALVATLVALLLVPVLWRKAQRLARRDFIATIPTSMNEIRAEVDRVRAEAAMTVRRHEILAAQARETETLGRADTGRLIASEANLTHQFKGLQAENASMREEIEALTTRLTSRDSLYTEMEGEHRGLRRDLELRAEEQEALTERLRELDNVADERRVRLVVADTKVEQLGSDLRSARRELLRQGEALDTTERALRDAQARLAALDGVEPPSWSSQVAAGPVAAMAAEEMAAEDEWADAQAEPSIAADERLDASPGAALTLDAHTRAALDDLRARTAGGTDQDKVEARERMAEVAARIIHASAAIEGPQSPIAELLRADGLNGSGSHGGLAERVRRLTGQNPEIDGDGILTETPDRRSAFVEDDVVDAQPEADDPAAVNATPGRRRRGGARARQRSRH